MKKVSGNSSTEASGSSGDSDVEYVVTKMEQVSGNSSPEYSGSYAESEIVEEAVKIINSIVNTVKNMINNEEWKEIKFLLKSEDFLSLLSTISKFPSVQRFFVTCYIIENFLEFLYFPNIMNTVLQIMKIFIEETKKNYSFSSACVEKISIFLVKNSDYDPLICKQVVRELFFANVKIWSDVEMILMHSLTQEEFYSNLAAINSSLIKLLYSVDSSMMCNVINFLSNTVNSEDYTIKRKSIKLALEIFTGEQSQFASGFYKLWTILCESMKDKNLDEELTTGFIMKLLVKQPLFRASYLHVLNFHVKFKSQRICIDIYVAIASAVLTDASIFINDSYIVTFIAQGFSSKKHKIQITVLLTLAKIYQSNLFYNYTFTALQESNWKKDNTALLNKILQSIHLNGSRVSLRVLLKGVIYTYLVPACLPQERRVANIVQMWMNMKSASRSSMSYISKASSKIRNSLLEALSCKPEISIIPYVKQMACCLGGDYTIILNLVTFFKRKLSELIMRMFLSESAEETIEIINHIREVALFKNKNWSVVYMGAMENILKYISNNLFDKESVILLLDEILKIAKNPQVTVSEIVIALDLFENVVIENQIITLQEAVFDRLAELYNLHYLSNIGTIFKTISKIPMFVIKMDKQKFQYYEHMVNVAKYCSQNILQE